MQRQVGDRRCSKDGSCGLQGTCARPDARCNMKGAGGCATHSLCKRRRHTLGASCRDIPLQDQNSSPGAVHRRCLLWRTSQSCYAPSLRQATTGARGLPMALVATGQCQSARDTAISLPEYAQCTTEQRIYTHGPARRPDCYCSCSVRVRVQLRSNIPTEATWYRRRRRARTKAAVCESRSFKGVPPARSRWCACPRAGRALLAESGGA